MTIATDYLVSQALFGGALIGSAAVLLMGSLGRIAGISGILAALLKPRSAATWQWAFLAGLVLVGVVYQLGFTPSPVVIPAKPIGLLVAGLLVGFGTRLSSGCTSGHGVCGLSRGSFRSLVATLIFMAAGMITVWLQRLLG